MWRSVLAFTLATAGSIAVASAAHAAADVSIKTTYYGISGKTGDALVTAMDRKGPKHGLLVRAIAQTKYSMSSGAMWVHENGTCRAINPSVKLDVTYIYPKVDGATSLPMKLRWARFIRGVEKHERVHGRLASEMAHAASKAIGRMRFSDSPDCRKSKARLKQQVAAIIDRYERQQVAFDEKEHRPGGRVDSLLGALRR